MNRRSFIALSRARCSTRSRGRLTTRRQRQENTLPRLQDRLAGNDHHRCRPTPAKCEHGVHGTAGSLNRVMARTVCAELQVFGSETTEDRFRTISPCQMRHRCLSHGSQRSLGSPSRTTAPRATRRPGRFRRILEGIPLTISAPNPAVRRAGCQNRHPRSAR